MSLFSQTYIYEARGTGGPQMFQNNPYIYYLHLALRKRMIETVRQKEKSMQSTGASG